mgnify:CR=1 FL=1
MNYFSRIFLVFFCFFSVSLGFAEPANLALLRQEVIKYHESAIEKWKNAVFSGKIKTEKNL